MGQPSSRSESEYSDGPSDVDMPDVSMLRSGDGISPDDGSDDYSFMSIGSSDDNSGIVRRKHRPKSLNLSRSISATSSEDETSDSAISTDVESKYGDSKYGGVQPPDPHEIRIALAASAFVEEMRVDLGNETDEEVAELSALEDANEGAKIRFSPSAPVSPSWREGLESPPFSPRRRDSYPGKRRGSSPVSPKDKKFNYNSDSSPPSRQHSLEDIHFDHKDTHTHAIDEQSHAYIAQRHSPKSPEELKDSYYGASSDMIMPYDRPTSNLKKSKPFYSLDDASVDLNDTTTVMDLATYAATVASNTANLTSMTVSPTNIDTRSSDITDMHDRTSPDSLGTSSPVSPGYYDNVSYPEEHHEEEEEAEGDIELADPSQKPIDYQGTKRQKARPPTTDWSPVIDLSPILDVSPSLEEAEQAEMLAQQQEERQRQASREDESYSPEAFTGVASGATGVDYMYYGLKRYEVVENITELLKKDNGVNSQEKSTACSNESEDRQKPCTSDSLTDKDDKFIPPVACSTTVTSKFTDAPPTSVSSASANRVVYSNDAAKGAQKTEAVSSPKGIVQKPDPAASKKSSEEPKEPPPLPNKAKARRKLPEPTAEIIATQKAPVPKPRRKDRPSDPPMPPAKPVRTSKQDTKEPARAAPTLGQSNPPSKPPPNKPPPRQLVKKQDSDERKRKAKDMKAKPDPLVMSHIATEEASSSPQYKVLESPPSPENKAAIRREYSDSTSVSPSSSPDREVYLYPSPVTPPDSDSSPPKPHSPSSGTDFEEEFVYQEESPKTKSSKYSNHSGEKRHQDKGHNDTSQGDKVSFRQCINHGPFPK